MGGIIDLVDKVLGTDFSGERAGGEAAEASRLASETAAGSQREALDYLKEKEALPSEIRNLALGQMAGLFGLSRPEGAEGVEGAAQFGDPSAFMERVKASPLYTGILSGREAGEEAILRGASATGGLRSGGTSEALYDYNVSLENQALLSSYDRQMSGLSQLSGLPSYAREIASGTAGIGETLAGGILGGAQGQIAARNMGFNQLMGLGQVGAAFLSDIRLKENIKFEKVVNGHNWYSWDWNDEAESIGVSGSSEGVMAHEIYETNPEMVYLTQDKYIAVDMRVLN